METSTSRQSATRAVAILSEALMDDPQFTWLFPEAEDRHIGQELLYRSLTERAHRSGLIHLTGSTGAAIWISLEAGQTPFGDNDNDNDGPVHPVLARHGERLTAWGKALTEHHPAQPAHIYLSSIGVLPTAQGQGVGSELLRRGLSRADATARPVYLESTTERSRRLYLRHGFTDLGAPIRICGGPPLWPMWRPPASAGG